MTNSIAVRRAAGVCLVVVPLVFTICFSLLAQLFDYPAILRQPTPEVLTRFAAGGSGLIAVWYVLTLSAVAFVPLSLLMHRVLGERLPSSMLLWVGTAFGLLAGVSQTLGFLRWPFLVPHLASTYLAANASEAQRAAAAMVFEAFHHYAGMAVGEHLGYLSTALWTLVVAVVVLRTAALPRWVGVSGVVLAVGIAFGLLEPAGVAFGALVNALSYVVWAVWLMAIGAMLLVRRGATVAVAAGVRAIA